MSEENVNNLWPMPKFYFEVSLGSQNSAVSFQEVSGLDTESQSIEYRHNGSKLFSTFKMPGLPKIGNVILKKGLFMNDDSFWDWFNAIKMNTIKRETVTIQLMDEKRKPTMTWTLTNAWPIKITGTDLKSDNNEIAVESLELAFEGFTIRNEG
jgi:phage tail-like protein